MVRTPYALESKRAGFTDPGQLKDDFRGESTLSYMINDQPDNDKVCE